MYILDTNTLIYFFKGKGMVAERLLKCSLREVGVPSIVLFELEFGICLSSAPEKRRAQLQRLMEVVTLLPFDGRAAKEAAKARAVLEQNGTPIGPLDLLIAATALAHGGVLVTHNTREFERVPGLQVEDWYE